MHITLIGMSNIGKSYWARHLAAKAGYDRVDCDHMVEEKLGGELVALGYKGIHDVAKWMGQPFDPQYAETSRKYWASERAVMLEAIAKLRASTDRPMVMDTTGSVIYMERDMIDAIRALSKVVYFEASEKHVAKLFERYMSNPKPVIWGENYAPLSDETPQESLRRCYPELLAYRAKRYSDMAHVTLSFEQHKAPGVSWDRLMAEGKVSGA